MDFNTLIGTETEKRLNKNMEYLYLSKLDKEFKDLTDKYNDTFAISIWTINVFAARERKCFGLCSYDEARKFIETYEAERANLLAQKRDLKDSFIHRKKNRKIASNIDEQLEKLNKKADFCKDAIKLEDEWKAKKEEYEKNRVAERLKEIEERTIRKVLKEKRNEPEVEEVFYDSILRNGEPNRQWNDSILSIAYRIVDNEVKKMLAKTKYKEQINDVKAQLEDEKE